MHANVLISKRRGSIFACHTCIHVSIYAMKPPLFPFFILTFFLFLSSGTPIHPNLACNKLLSLLPHFPPFYHHPYIDPYFTHLYNPLSSTLPPRLHPSIHPLYIHLSLSIYISLMASAIRAPLMGDIMSQKACEKPATLGLRKDSHMISKMKPKIRVVHIFAPEIIKTDVENFRELVQRLTGKPTKRDGSKKKAAPAAMVDSTEAVGMRRSYRDPWGGERVEGEQREERRKLRTEGTSGGFLTGFGDVDAIFQGLGDFPLLPLCSSHVDGIGEVRN